MNSLSNIISQKNEEDRFSSLLIRNHDLITYGYPIERLSLIPGALRFLSRTSAKDNTLYIKAEESVDGRIDLSLGGKYKIAVAIWKFDKRLFHLLSRLYLKVEKVKLHFEALGE